MAPPTICFVARADFEAKPGGDTVQWRMYERAAREAGLSTRTWFDDAQMPEADVYHALNILNPLDLYPKLVEVSRRGRPFILSAIHHSHEWLIRFRRHQPPTGLLGKLLYRSPVGRSVATSETAREAAMSLVRGRFARLPRLLPSWRTRVTWLLTRAERIALLSRREGVDIERDFACPISDARALHVPNWVEEIDAPASEAPDRVARLAEPPVLAVGRIEPRKHSLGVARLAHRARRSILFVGEPHPMERAYVREFAGIERESPWVHWVRGVPRSEIAQFYGHAAFLLNASFLEVSPFVDIEALAFGCPIVTTYYAAHHDLLPPGTPTCDPYDEASLLEWLSWRPERLKPIEVVDREAVKQTLVQAYRDVARAGRTDTDAAPLER
jgi:glycosyltransferase involved in cell wall biosynthesis